MKHKQKIKLDSYIIKIYRNNIFVGYVSSYRKHRNGKYRFEKTKNIYKALHYYSLTECFGVEIKLDLHRDMLIYNNSYHFDAIKITDREIRKSKLNVLNKVKIKEGIFGLKNKNLS